GRAEKRGKRPSHLRPRVHAPPPRHPHRRVSCQHNPNPDAGQAPKGRGPGASESARVRNADAWIVFGLGGTRMFESLQTNVPEILVRLIAAGVIGACIGFERRAHHKAVGISGMILIAIGSATYMLLAKHLTQTDPSSVSRTLQGLLSGIGFLGGAVIFKSGADVK